MTSSLHNNGKSQGERQGKKTGKDAVPPQVGPNSRSQGDNVLLLKAMLLYQYFLYALIHTTAFSIHSVLLYHTTSHDMFLSWQVCFPLPSS